MCIGSHAQCSTEALDRCVATGRGGSGYAACGVWLGMREEASANAVEPSSPRSARYSAVVIANAVWQTAASLWPQQRASQSRSIPTHCCSVDGAGDSRRGFAWAWACVWERVRGGRRHGHPC